MKKLLILLAAAFLFCAPPYNPTKWQEVRMGINDQKGMTYYHPEHGEIACVIVPDETIYAQACVMGTLMIMEIVAPTEAGKEVDFDDRPGYLEDIGDDVDTPRYIDESDDG